MANELSEADAKKLFEQTSKALQNSDELKLTELMETKELPEEEVPPVEKEEAEVPEEDTPPETPDDKDSKGDESDKDPDKDKPSEEEPEDKKGPPAKADKATEKKEDDKPEPTEADKLREQIEKLSKENHDLKSQAGRVPSIQRKLKDLDKKLEELAKRDTSPSSQPSAKIKPKIDELLKGVSEDDPALAKAIAAAIAEAVDGVASESAAKEKETLTFLRDTEARVYQDVEADRLIQMYPNAPEVFQSKSWAEWKAEQTAGIRRLAESDTADDVAYAFDKYAKDMVAKFPDLAPKVEAKKEVETPPPEVDNEAAEKARRLEEERRRKKETAPNLGSPNLPGKVNLPDDPEALFKKFSEEIRKERTG